MNNSEIADRLDALASMLELVEASPYSARAYRRAAETIRGAALPVVELVRSERVRELARMLAGMDGTETGRAHAEELLAVAEADKAAFETKRKRGKKK